MTVTFHPAVRQNTLLMIGIAGPSGSGKTFSALRLAKGLANGGKVVMIDTESGRGTHYADQFDYDYAEMAPPFRPSAYLEAIQAAERAGAAVVIVDSTSHMHEGPGGILEWHEEELTRMAGDDWAKRERVKFSAWIKPKAEMSRFVNGALQVRCHLIFCFRAKEKLALVKNDKGKQEPVPMGWQPIITDRFEYEMTTLLMLPPNSRGVPDLQALPTKLQEQHTSIIKAGKQIDENMGRQFAEWARGSGAAKSEAEPAIVAQGREVATRGTDALRDWYKAKSKADRAEINGALDKLRRIAEQADKGELDRDPFADTDSPAAGTPNGDGTHGEAAPAAGEPETVGDILDNLPAGGFGLIRPDGTEEMCADAGLWVSRYEYHAGTGMAAGAAREFMRSNATTAGEIARDHESLSDRIVAAQQSIRPT